MGLAGWRAWTRAFPGPIGWAVWIGATVPGPLLFWDSRLRWEESVGLLAIPLAMLPAVLVLAAVVAARWTASTGRRRRWSAFLAAVVVAMVVTAVGVAASMAVFRWIIPLSVEYADPDDVLMIGAVMPAGAALVGAVIGYFLGLRGAGDPIGLPVRLRYVLGGTFAVAGALVAPVTLQLGAEGSTVEYKADAYGGVGSHVSSAGGPGRLTVPNSGWYAIYAVGFSPKHPDCRVAGPGVNDLAADLVTAPPGGYGSDYASFAWVASVDLPAAGTYMLNCRTSDPDASYTVGDVPEIRGPVRFMIHFPLPVIWLLGALPGLVIIADAARRGLAERAEVRETRFRNWTCRSRV